jgi:hypothetical protein
MCFSVCKQFRFQFLMSNMSLNYPVGMALKIDKLPVPAKAEEGSFSTSHSFPKQTHCRIKIVVAHVGGVRPCLWTATSNRPIVHPPDYIWEWRTTVEWYRQGKTENSAKILSQCYFVHHNSHMAWHRREPEPAREWPATNRLARPESVVQVFISPSLFTAVN